MESALNIVGYCRISVDEEMDRENTSIENQKMIISDFVNKKFPTSNLSFYEDRDRSGYTFEQREGYQDMRKKLMNKEFDILVVKDFSRFARRNSRGLVELEDLRDAGIRIISIGDSIDYPTYDDWTAIQFRFLINEMPVTDTSKKVKRVIERRQSEGKWICSVPYGYVITNHKTMQYEIDEAAAVIIKKIYELYLSGWGYKKIANHLTDMHIPTPRMSQQTRKEEAGEEYRGKVRPEWSIITVSDILKNDFYIGTLRQGKYHRKKINGQDVKADESNHIVFENHHQPIIEYRTFAAVQEQLKLRTRTNYRGVKKYDNVYSGFLVCGDCGRPMFSMSRKDIAPAYTCSSYHKRGLAGCTSHHTKVETLDKALKIYIEKVMNNSKDMIDKLNDAIKNEKQEIKGTADTISLLEKHIEDAKQEIKMLTRQKVKDIARNPDRETILEETYSEMLDELSDRIEGLQNQLELTINKRSNIIQVNRAAKTVLDIFKDILNKEKLDKCDLELIIEKIYIYKDHIEIKLKADIDALLCCESLEKSANFNSGIIDSLKTVLVQSAKNRKDKVYNVNVIREGDPLEIYTDVDGEVIFKKYSPVGEISTFASQYAEVLTRVAGLPVLICDKDHVIAVAGVSKREYMERRVTPVIEEMMETRRSFAARAGDMGQVQPIEGIDSSCAIMHPIIAAGDVTGAVIMLSGSNMTVPSETEIKLVQSAAAFLGKQMEE